MTTRSTPKRIKRIYVRKLRDGLDLKAEISPCVYMDPGYPLQIAVTLHRHPGETLGHAYAVDRTKDADSFTDACVKRLLAKVRISPCPRCSAPAFDPSSIETNRGGLCEPCFIAALKAEWEQEEQAESARLAQRDCEMKRQGMTVRVTAWVHPDDGDDYQVDWYFTKKPLPGEIKLMLAERGSQVLDDFAILVL